MSELNYEQMRMLQLILRETQEAADQSREAVAVLPERSNDVATDATERFTGSVRRPR